LYGDIERIRAAGFTRCYLPALVGDIGRRAEFDVKAI